MQRPATPLIRSVSRFVAILLLLGTAATDAAAQGRGPGGESTATATLNGSVVDAETRTALASATVSVWNRADSTLATGVIAGRDGAFALRGVRPGRYYLRIAYVGYRTTFVDDLSVPAAGGAIAVGEIALTSNASELGGVTVTAERDFMTVEIDRNVYSTDDMPVAAGGDATDVLRNIPSVDVDVDGNVSLRGNQNVAVQINGRPVMMSGEALANFLQTLPAGTIERVEVIANPSARYDPEGMGGILNIELKKGEELGLTGGVNAGIGSNGSYSAGANVNYGSGPLNLTANYGFNRRVREMLGSRLQESRTIEPTSRLFAGDTGESASMGHSLNASLDYAFDDRSSLSLSSRFGVRTSDALRTTTTTVGDAASPLGTSIRATDDDDRGLNMDHRLGYKWTGERRVHELAAELRYSVDDDAELSFATLTDSSGIASGPLRQQIDLDDRSHDVDAKLDYTRPLWDDARLEAGYAGSMRSLTQSYASLASDETGSLAPDGRSNAFTFDETLHGVYAIVGQTIDDVDLQVGLRGELASTEFALQTTEETFDNEYFSLFPSALVGYRPSDETQLRLSYSKRITRPRTRLLNPFSTSTDPQFRHVGNPYLRPEYTHGLELSINQFVPWGTLQLTPYVRRTTDAIERFERVDSAGVVTMTFENLGQVDSYGAELLSTARFGDWLNTVASVGLFQEVTDASNVGVEGSSNALSLSGRLTATANVGWGTSVQATVGYRSPRTIVNGHSDAFVRSDIALTKTFLDDRAKIGLRVSDPFDQAGMRSWRETDGYYIETERLWGGRTAMLTFSYLFGQQRDQARRDRGGDTRGEEEGEIDW